jgi:endonuclease YncB( thermonuclease family)
MPGRRGVLLPVLLILLLPSVPGLSSARAPARADLPGTALVSRVLDGDTIQVRTRDGAVLRVRLIGVDTPERGDRNEDNRFWAEMATRFAVQDLLGEQVRLTYDRETEDKYGRLLAFVAGEGPETFNEHIIREGYSAAYLRFPFRSDYQDAFRRAEAEARREGRGIWGGRTAAVIGPSEGASHPGEYVTVRFRCGRVSAGRRYSFLWSEDRRFEALLKNDTSWGSFRTAQGYRGREMSVTGVLEVDRGFNKIYVLFPRQLAE